MTHLFLFLVAFVLSLGAAAPAQAYLDPGTGSMILQVLLGGIAGVAVVVKLYWKQAQGLLRRHAGRRRRIRERANPRMIGSDADPGSFRDPGGRVFVVDGRVFRTVNPPAVDDYEFVESTGVMAELVEKGWVIGADPVDPGVLGERAAGARYVLEHPRLPLVTYPYEWSFPALRAAALRHLDVQLAALAHDVALSDATAYNIQFIGPRPVFIDRLSFVRYREGELWAGHRQFTEQFLNPLLLRSLFGVCHNSWYRGAQEGISAGDLKRLLKFRHKLSLNVFSHVVLQSAFQSSVSRSDAGREGESVVKAGLPRAGFERMLRKLHSWIEGLEPADSGKTVWQDYAGDNSYSDDEAVQKRKFVGDFAAEVRPGTIWDFGCNTGDYCVAALEGGAGYAVGFDFDQGALEQAFDRAQSQDLPLQTLFLDAANPASGQGWAEGERQGLRSRADADAILALAFVHHLAIAKNIPLDDLVDWLIGMAPTGVIEFVPKQDAMVRELLRFREDIFPGYTEEGFRALVAARARIVREEQVSASGRRLVWFDRRP